MDVQILIIGGAVFVISALLIYLISVFGMREKTYEEVIAEQRQKNIELFGKSGPDGEKKRDKKVRKRKKEKQVGSAEDSPNGSGPSHDELNSPQVESTHKMLELEIEPEIIETDLSRAPEPKKKGQDKKTKSILHNKNEKTPVSKVSHVEEKFHPKVTPMDDLELKLERERKQSVDIVAEEATVVESTTPKSKKGKKAAKEAKPEPEPEVVEEVVQATSAAVVQSEPKKGKKQKGAAAAPAEISKGNASLNQRLIKLVMHFHK